MHWYATEPLVTADKGRALKLAAGAKVPYLREFIARRMAAGSNSAAPRRKGPRAEPAESVSDTGLVLLLKAGAGVKGEGDRLSTWKDQSDEGWELSAAPGNGRPETGEKAKGRPVVWFDGQDDHVWLPHSKALAFGASSSFTVSAWVYLEERGGGGWRGVVTKSRDAGPWYGIWIDGGNRWVFGGSGNIQGDVAVPGWQHVCAVQEGGKGRKLYVDGALSATGSAGRADGTGDLWIGGAKSVREFFEGAIGEVRIYRRALSAAEVSKLARKP